MDENFLKRRQFLKAVASTAVVAGIGGKKILSISEAISTNSTQPHADDKAMPFSDLIGSLSGLSAAQMRLHLSFYRHCCDLLGNIMTVAPNIDLASSDCISSPWRNHQISLLDCHNKVMLHRLYFSGLGPSGGSPSGVIKKQLITDFGSVDQWWIEFKATAMSVRGWAVLGWDVYSNRLMNMGFDEDSQFPVMFHPILIVDVHEHAYEIDFPGDRLSYLDSWYKNILWQVVKRRYAAICIKEGKE